MSEPLTIDKVIDVVKSYVNGCGGLVPLEDLLQDFKIAYHSPLPFASFGYTSVEDFLYSIDGIKLYELDHGAIHVQYIQQNSEPRDDFQTSELDDLTQLTVQMKNTLLLDSHQDSRVVEIKPREVPSVHSSSLSYHRKEAGGNGALGSQILPPGSGPQFSWDYQSTNAGSTQNELSSSFGVDYPSFKNGQPLAPKSYSSSTNDPSQCQEESYNAVASDFQYQTDSSEYYLNAEGLLGESVDPPGPTMTNLLDPCGNPCSSAVHQTGDTLRQAERTYGSIYTPDAHPHSTSKSFATVVPTPQYVPSSGNSYAPSLYQSQIPQDVSAMNTSVSSLPTNNNVSTLQSTGENAISGSQTLQPSSDPHISMMHTRLSSLYTVNSIPALQSTTEKAASSSQSWRPDSGPQLNSNYHSTYGSTQNNLTSSSSVDYLSIQNDQPFDFVSRSHTNDPSQLQEEGYRAVLSEAQYQTASSEYCLSAESSLRGSVHAPGPTSINLPKPGGNLFYSRVQRMEGTFRPPAKAYDRIYAPDAYPQGTYRPPMTWVSTAQRVPPSEMTYAPNVHPSLIPQNISTINTFRPSLPTVNNVSTLQSTVKNAISGSQTLQPSSNSQISVIGTLLSSLYTVNSIPALQSTDEKAASGSQSWQPNSGPQPNPDYQSTYGSTQNNLSPNSRSAIYPSSFKDAQPFAVESRSNVTSGPSLFHGESYRTLASDAQYQAALNDYCHSAERSLRGMVPTPGPTTTTNPPEPGEKSSSSSAMQPTRDTTSPTKQTYDPSISTPNAYLRGKLRPPMTLVPLVQRVPPSGSIYAQSRLYQSPTPQLNSAMKTFQTSLPTPANNVPTVRSPLTSINLVPVLSTTNFLAPVVLANTLPTSRLPHSISSPPTSTRSGDPRPLTPDELINRIVTLVNTLRQVGGINCATIERKYFEKYSTPLPEQWLTRLEERGVLYVEKLTRETLVYPRRRFIASCPKVGSLPHLRCPSIDNPWNVHVSLYESTSSIWFRLKDEDFGRRYEILQCEMRRHYSRQSSGGLQNLTEVTAGQLCAVNFRNEWFRGEVLEHDPKAGWVKSFLVDEGIVQNFMPEKIYPLHHKFTNTPGLIFRGELSSLEKWGKCNYINCEVRQHFHEQSDVTVKVQKFLHDKVVSMRVYFDSQKLDLNAWAADFARTQLDVPTLHAGQTYDIIIISSRVCSNVRVLVQIKSTCFQILQDTLQKVSNCMKDPKTVMSSRIRAASEIQLKDKIYLARCTAVEWKRIICLKLFDNDTVLARFIDFAEEKFIHFHNIFETSVVSDIVCFIEPQAVLVELLEVDAVVMGFLEHAKDQLLGHEISFRMEILQLGSPPLVKLLAQQRGSEQFLPMEHFLKVLKVDDGEPSELK